MEKKEAIKILKDFHDKSALFSVRTALETLCPELKESEDEKIRKGLIKLVQRTENDELCCDYGHSKNDFLAWLEKQKDINALIQEASEKAYTEGMRVERKRWLEKQGESYTKRDVDDAWLKGMCDAKRELEKQAEVVSDKDDIEAEEKGIRKAFDKIWEEKQDKQKSQRMISAKAKEALYDKPAEWSEEDENRLSDAIFFVREYQIPTRDKKLLEAAKETEDWLKSLKKRIGG